MIREEQAAKHDANFVTAISMMASGVSAGWTGAVGRIPLAITGIPAPFFNAAWIVEPPDRLVISRVGHADLTELQAATAAGFGMPVEMVELVYPAAMLAAPGVRAFIGRIDGEAACTAMSVREEATVGVYSITTLPAYRGRGYETAITWHLMADADPGWDLAVLQASEIGRPVYERMGFHLIRQFVEFIGGRGE